jgi:hypothetical protein
MRMENLCISDERWTIRPDVCIGVMATRHKCTIASLFPIARMAWYEDVWRSLAVCRDLASRIVPAAT